MTITATGYQAVWIMIPISQYRKDPMMIEGKLLYFLIRLTLYNCVIRSKLLMRLPNNIYSYLSAVDKFKQISKYATFENIEQESTEIISHIVDLAQDHTEVQYENGIIEKTFADFSRVVFYPDGSCREINADGSLSVNFLYNGDILKISSDKEVIYIYSYIILYWYIFDTLSTHYVNFTLKLFFFYRFIIMQPQRLIILLMPMATKYSNSQS